MFARLFGESDEQQVHYLQSRVVITALSLVIMIFFNYPSVFAFVMMVVWGWGAVKAFFGITTIGAIFSGNIVFGVIIFLMYFILSYLVGVFCAALGIGRYVYLLIKRAKEKR